MVLALGVPLATALAICANLIGSRIENRSTGVVEPWAGLLELLNAGLVIVGIALGMLMAAALVYRRWPVHLMTTAPTWRWRLLALGLGLSLGLQAVGLALSLGVDPPGVWLPTGWSALHVGLYGLAAVAVVSPFVVAEEILFRGWLVRPALRFTVFTAGMFLSSCVMFAAFHLETEPLHLAMHLISGAAYAWSVIRLGGLEFAIGAHLGRNVLVVLWVDLAGRVMSDGTLSAALTANMVVSMILIVLVEVTVRRMPSLNKDLSVIKSA
jgi:membrane protease YdiL (CAAX protease family)